MTTLAHINAYASLLLYKRPQFMGRQDFDFLATTGSPGGNLQLLNRICYHPMDREDLGSRATAAPVGGHTQPLNHIRSHPMDKEDLGSRAIAGSSCRPVWLLLGI